MNFTTAIPFAEAVSAARDRAVLPTDLGSAELRVLDAAVKRRAIFSARTTNASFLQDLGRAIEKAVNPQTEAGVLGDPATIRAELLDSLKGLGYTPEGGFPLEGNLPAVEGSLQDLSSSARLQLIVDTQIRQAFGYGHYQAGLKGAAANSFPAWELVRIYPRDVERGFRRTKAGLVEDPDMDWPTRWQAAGGDFYDGRMIAPKDSDVWQNLGDGMGDYNDTLGNPYPPFAFNSGMGVLEVDREECLSLGVIQEGDEVATDDTEFNDSLKLNAEAFDEDFLKELQDELKGMAS